MDPTDQTQDQAAAGSQDTLISSKGLSEAAQTGDSDPKGGAENQVETTGGEKPASGEITVDIGGALKRVSVDELVQAFQKRGEIEQLQGVMDQKLTEMGQARALQNLISEWTPEQQSQLEQVMQKIHQGEYRQPSQDDGDDFDLEDDERRQPHQRYDPEMQKRLDHLERLVTPLAQERHQQTVGQRIDAEMASFPVFSEDQAAAEFAKDAIRNKMAANPRGDLGEMVAEVAAQTHKIIQASQERVLPRRQSASGDFPEITKPEKPFTGADMQSGALLRHLRSTINGT